MWEQRELWYTHQQKKDKPSQNYFLLNNYMSSGILWLHIVETERVIGKEKTEGYLCHLNSQEKCKVRFQWADLITHIGPEYYDTVFILAAENTKLMLRLMQMNYQKSKKLQKAMQIQCDWH